MVPNGSASVPLIVNTEYLWFLEKMEALGLRESSTGSSHIEGAFVWALRRLGAVKGCPPLGTASLRGASLTESLPESCFEDFGGVASSQCDHESSLSNEGAPSGCSAAGGHCCEEAGWRAGGDADASSSNLGSGAGRSASLAAASSSRWLERRMALSRTWSSSPLGAWPLFLAKGEEGLRGGRAPPSSRNLGKECATAGLSSTRRGLRRKWGSAAFASPGASDEGAGDDPASASDLKTLMSSSSCPVDARTSLLPGSFRTSLTGAETAEDVEDEGEENREDGEEEDGDEATEGGSGGASAARGDA